MNGLHGHWQREWQQMSNVDWQSLDVKEAGEWPLLLKILCSFLVFLMAFWGVGWWLISDKYELLNIEQRQEVRLLNEYRSKASEAAFSPDIHRHLLQLEEQITWMRAMLSTNEEMPALLDSLSGAAIENQLAIEAIRLQPSITTTHFIEHPLDIQVRGSYHQLARFLADVSQLNPIITQHDLSLVAIAPNADVLKLSLLARTYSYINAETQLRTSP